MGTQTTRPAGTQPSGTSARQLPVPTGSETFTAKGQTYEILRFSEGKGPNLLQTITIAEGMKGKRMLTHQEAREIRDNGESNLAFRNALKPGEWAYVRDPEVEKRFLAAYLLFPDRYYRRLFVYDNGGPDNASRVMLVKLEPESKVGQIKLRE